MNAKQLLEKLMALRIREGDRLEEIPVMVATGHMMDPFYETQIDVAEVRPILGHEVFYIGREHDYPEPQPDDYDR